MATKNTSLSYRAVESAIATTTFRDARGHNFEVTYDTLTGEVIEASCANPTGNLITIIMKHDGALTSWVGKKIRTHEGGSASEENAEMTDDSVPGLTRYLSDARFDDEYGELKLASRRRTKRWIFRTNGTAEFFSPHGHVRLRSW